MQSGQSLFCLSLRRLAILLTTAGSRLVTTLRVLLRCDWKRGRDGVCFLWARHACLMREWTGREIIVGMARNQVPSCVAQAAFLPCWGVISTPSTLIQIYEDNQSAGKRLWVWSFLLTCTTMWLTCKWQEKKTLWRLLIHLHLIFTTAW